MDQVPLPFVVDQNKTYTVEGDEHVHIRSPGSDGLEKRQYTMHIFVNAGDGADADGYIDMIARGKGTRISAAEKAAWNTEVNVLWQKCAWVDRPIMLQIAETFGEHVKAKHGGKPVLLFCDNLDAHCHHPVLVELKRANVFVCFVPPQCTDSVQAIDAGIGRSIRIYVGHELDKWLEVDDNLERWEKGLKAKERRILMTHWLAAAMAKLLQQPDLVRKCYERTGMLIKLKANEDDVLVKPQGLKLPYTIPTEVQAFPPAVPEEREPESSIESNGNDAIGDSADGGAAGENDVTVDEQENAVLDTITACAGITVNDVDHYIACCDGVQWILHYSPLWRRQYK